MSRRINGVIHTVSPIFALIQTDCMNESIWAIHLMTVKEELKSKEKKIWSRRQFFSKLGGCFRCPLAPSLLHYLWVWFLFFNFFFFCSGLWLWFGSGDSLLMRCFHWRNLVEVVLLLRVWNFCVAMPSSNTMHGWFS